MILKLLFCLSVAVTLPAVNGQLSPFAWECQNYQCEKVLAADSSTGMPLNKCKLTCGMAGVVWPLPVETMIGDEVAYFHDYDIHDTLECQGDVCHLLSQAIEIFKENLNNYFPEQYKNMPKSEKVKTQGSKIHAQVSLSVSVTGTETRLTLDTDESYTLSVTTADGQVEVMINAPTFFGARHGLETLSQVINFDLDNLSLQIVDSVTIKDSPVFPYRGVLLDTSRNFIPIDDIKRTIDAMSANKMNSFHWHITDTGSWPLHIVSLPNATRWGAYSPFEIYRRKEIQEVVAYGQVRGVRVLPEIDAPAHFGTGFEWGETEGLGNLAVCINKQPWATYCAEPPCGQINLANPEIYDILSKIYDEVVAGFAPIDLFHYGGDEVNLACYNTTKEITDWMIEKGNDLSAHAYYQEWTNFQIEASKRFTESNGAKAKGILWTSELIQNNDQAQYLSPADYIIQIWTTGNDPLVTQVLQLGFDIIYSNYDDLYLDCGMGGWVTNGNSWCDPYKGWARVYANNPGGIAGGTYINQVLGSEAALWTEKADEQALDNLLWPRAAALAERLWSNPVTGWKEALDRMLHHRNRMVERGIRAERLQPEWCHQNEGNCFL